MTNGYIKGCLKRVDKINVRTVYDNGFIASTCWVPYHGYISGCLLSYNYTPLSYVAPMTIGLLKRFCCGWNKRSKCMIMASSLALVGCPTILSSVHWYPCYHIPPLSYVPGYPCYSHTPAVICAWVPLLSYTPTIICAWYPHYLVCLGSPAFIHGSEVEYVKHSGRGSLIITFHQWRMYK